MDYGIPKKKEEIAQDIAIFTAVWRKRDKYKYIQN